MKKRIYNQTSLFGPLYAYLVVLSPPDSVKNEVARIKRELNEIAGIGERNLHSIAHVTIIDKLTDDINFAEVITGLIAGGKGFNVKIGGWGFFDHGQSVTVYLKVDNPEPVLNLMQLVKSPSRSPHISLAKKIPNQIFRLIGPYLESLQYTADWDCNEVNVLRKLMSEKELGFKESFKISLSPV
jgi:2'-5' RNA ligase